MSLATRCSACGTVFRVVQDQLKVSEGWVRCGRCSEVFNALEGLFDLERDSRPESWMPTVPDPGDFVDPTEPAANGQAAASTPSTFDDDARPAADGGEGHTAQTTHPAPSAEERFDEHLFGPPRDASQRRTGDLPDRDQLEFADARLEDDRDSAAPRTDTPFDELHPATGTMPLESEQVEAAAAAAQPPEFVQRADRAARWRRPGMRLLLGLLALVLLGGLGLQVAHHERDRIAAHWPEARPALEALCVQAGCRIEPLRRIEDLVVDSTTLVRAGAQADVFRLAVSLHNRGDVALAVPSIELTLTDAGGEVVARRALSPQDFRVAATTIAPGAESSMQLLLAAGSPRVAGYTVEIFYP